LVISLNCIGEAPVKVPVWAWRQKPSRPGALLN